MCLVHWLLGPKGCQDLKTVRNACPRARADDYGIRYVLDDCVSGAAAYQNAVSAGPKQVRQERWGVCVLRTAYYVLAGMSNELKFGGEVFIKLDLLSDLVSRTLVPT